MAVHGKCTSAEPLVIPLGGPLADEDRLGLVFTPTRPCGVEVGPTVATLNPLVLLYTWTECVGEPDCPGAMVLLRASVQRLVSQRSGDLRSQHISGCEGETAEPRVKLKIQACGNQGPVWIDSDSQIVIPAGLCTIEVWGPNNWHLMGRFTTGSVTWTDVWLKITACPLDCYAPSGVLTTWLRYTEPAWAAIADRVFLRPRRARGLLVNAVNEATPAGAPAAISVNWYNGDPSAGIGALRMGAVAFTTGSALYAIPGAYTHAEIYAPAAGVTLTATMVWFIP